MSNLLPGYLTIPTEKEVDLETYMSTRGFKPLRPNQMSYWQNYRKFFVSFQKAMWGSAATPENSFAYDWLPKLDVAGYDILRALDLMGQGKMTGYMCQGFNPLLAAPNRRKVTDLLSKLKFLVTMDPLDTETARFWENHGEYNDVDPSQIQTEVIQLPPPASPKTKVRSPIPAAGCSGIGRVARLRAKRRPITGSWRRSMCG